MLITATTSIHLPNQVSNDLTIKSDLVLTRWDARAIDVIKHLLHSVFLL